MLTGLGRLLKQYGYDSELFSSARGFELRGNLGRAICIVLDIQLNGESGIDLRLRLSAAGVALPVIYISANDNDAVRMAALDSGCIAFLTKPFPARALIAPIQRAAAGIL